MRQMNFLMNLFKMPLVGQLTFALAASLPLSAVERPGGPGEPKYDEVENPQVDKAQKQAFLGVVGVPMSSVLASHLKLDGGVVLSLVGKGTPAAKAGLQRNDVITSVDSVVVKNHRQLSAVIAEKAVGDKLAISLIRAGEKKELTATLGTRPVSRLSVAPRKGQGEDPHALLMDLLRDVPQGGVQPEAIRDMQKRMAEMSRAMGAEGLKLDALPFGQLDHEQLIDQLQRQLGDDSNAVSHSSFSSSAGVTLMDNEGSIQLQENDGSRTVTIKNRGGEVVFAGPYNTKEEKSAVPQKHQSRLKGLDLRSFSIAPKEKQEKGRLKQK